MHYKIADNHINTVTVYPIREDGAVLRGKPVAHFPYHCDDVRTTARAIETARLFVLRVLDGHWED